MNTIRDGVDIGSGEAGAVMQVAASATIQALSGVVAAAGTAQVPGDVLTLSGGSSSTAAKVNVTNTKVIAAVVVSGGTLGTPGAVTITGTTGTGTKFQATGTINGSGVLAGALVVSVAGDYTANPTSIAVEPVTGGGLSGCTVILTMGVKTATINTAGAYSVLPSNPVSQGASTGAGTAATFTMTWGVGPVVLAS